MGIKKTLEEKILSRSNSYKFYKDYYEKHSGVSNPKLEKQLKQLQKDFNDYKSKNDAYIDSANYLFNTLFIDYEMNNPTALLNNIQMMCKELLNLVGNICEKHDLTWWIAGGNLLGAVRHRNFVPWDDDMDIALMRKDYIVLYEVINEEIEKTGLDDIVKVHYRHRKIDNCTINTFLQLSVKHPISNRKNPVLGRVDVLPYDYIKDYNENTIVDDHFNAKINFFRNLNKNMGFEYAINKLYDELNLSMEKTDKIIPGVEGSFGKNNLYKLVIFDTDEMFPIKQAQFGDSTLPVLNNPDHYLKKVYGDYLSVPKKVRTHSSVDTFRYATDAEEVFDKCYSRLKEVNDKF